MSVSVTWEDEQQTIVRLGFPGQWTTEELRRMGVQAILMVRSVKHPVYVISDFSQSGTPPAGVLWQARDLNQIRPDNWEAGITITNDGLVRSLIQLFGSIYMGKRRKRLFVARTIDEARDMIDTLKKENLVS